MQIITTTTALQELAARFAKYPYMTIDTEFLRESTFWPILCLVQVATDDESAIIDPMAEGIDLQPLFDLLQDENVLKVFHAGRQDLEIFHHLNGEVPKPIFDTQVAAMVCGFGESVGYDTLVAKITGKGIDKSSRFTDWSRRPLSERQLTYAEADVTHLRDVYKFLANKLKERGREEWVASEMEILRAPETYFIPPMEAWQRIKARNNNSKFLGILQAVAAWREEQAHRQDIPRNRVLRDEALLEISSNPPKSPEALSHVRGIGQKFADGHMGRGLLAAVEAGVNLPPEQRPTQAKKSPPPKGIGPLMELLRVLLKLRCEENEVAQKLVCNMADLERIAAEDDADIPVLKGWRRRVFGEDALKLKNGEIALSSENGKIRIISL
ncbi:ribonuclease D [uncultured Sneathiella sp.]|jgi:ribonuclease D|uniref:ribonuclease D n=2 Tax=uncultured Sneathiella sp. TaxID=879315 RepID=UPI0030D763F1|tara:strand:- start:20276 stop:21424 length:1149 start_codon:yes stop_codon:yes gene_type:complete